MKGVSFETGYTKYIRKDGKVTLSEFSRWRVRIIINGKLIRKGFKTEKEAIEELNKHKRDGV